MKNKSKTKKLFKRIQLSFLGIILLTLCGLFLTPYGHNLRILAAENILNTPYHSLAKYTFLSDEELEDITSVKNVPPVVTEKVVENENLLVRAFLNSFPKPIEKPLRINVDNITVSGGHYFKGKLMSISNPLNVILTTQQGTQGTKVGEQISVMAQREHAIAAINASGFYDPTYKDAGNIPVGIVIENGLIKNTVGNNDTKDSIMGLTDEGKMVTGVYSPNDLLQLNVKYAAGFQPLLLANGKKMITDPEEGRWHPRTAVAQKEDGTLLFLVIDGRQPSYSMGATLMDVQNILYEHGAINAFAMDGGDSSVMYLSGKIITQPSSLPETGRFLPNSWLVVPKDGQKYEVYVNGQLMEH